MAMNSVVHFEMPATDNARVAAFYTNVFGWKMQELGADMGNYLMATTTPTGENGLPKEPGAINGGFFKPEAGQPHQHPSVVIAVEDIKAHIEKIKAAGGTVVTEIQEIPGIGQYVSFRDTEGNLVGMLQPLPMG